MSDPRPAQIMMIEDNPADQIVTKRALKRARVLNEVQIFETAETALTALQDASAATPDLILLDLSLPGMSGQQFLSHLKENSAFKHIPVAALSSSQAESDIVSSWDLGVIAYLVKPVAFGELCEIMEHLTALYLQFVVLPKAPE
jgi:CheY-like chemotaxis protein